MLARGGRRCHRRAGFRPRYPWEFLPFERDFLDHRSFNRRSQRRTGRTLFATRERIRRLRSSPGDRPGRYGDCVRCPPEKPESSGRPEHDPVGPVRSEPAIRRFRLEAEAAANLDHPGIVPIFEIGEHEGHHFFSMALVDGKSLAVRVAEGPLPPREAAELVRLVGQAIQYAHEKGVIHRDLKPANVLIDSQGRPKVTDFGLAKRLESDSDLTHIGQIMGTPNYWPPEQAEGRPVGPLADVYSLGAPLYCLLIGRPPFQAATPLGLVKNEMSEKIGVKNKRVAAACNTRCMEKVLTGT
ncbi:MAG: serine/threonine-protein kinase [Isosphaeraceae bacterium]